MSHRLSIVEAVALVSAIWAGVIVAKTRKASDNIFHIAFNEWVGFAPFFLAKERGYFGGLSVVFHFIASEKEKRAGLDAGRFQMICETVDMFQSGRDAAPYPGRIVFAIDESCGGDGVIAVKKITSPKDLTGRVAVSEPGQASHLVFQCLLRKGGMTLKDMKLQAMDASDAAAAFIAGRADVAATYEPYLGNALRARPDSHMLFSSKDLPGLILDVAIASEETLRTRKGDVAFIYAGWCKAVDFFEEKRAEAMGVMADPFKLTPEDFGQRASELRYFDRRRNAELFGRESAQGAILETFKTIGEILLANGLTRIVDTPSSKIDLSVVAGSIP